MLPRLDLPTTFTAPFNWVVTTLCPGALPADEAEDFIKLLDSRELAASADERLLVHLLLRADSINRKTTDWRKLKVTGLGWGPLAAVHLCKGTLVTRMRWVSSVGC